MYSAIWGRMNRMSRIKKSWQSLGNLKMAHQNNSASTANLISPEEPEEEKPAISFQFILGAMVFSFIFLVSYSTNTDHSHSPYSHSRRDKETHS